ncbi:hypothetical protein GCM10023185_03350 [Hymenobacter saemangeumensis]|uniref:T9SS type A sorting domain-containing protein n=2 Tax=Hymenobacter saemangeumensis TaxID=1084522 RepID=A0ABP8HZ77_9BACT
MRVQGDTLYSMRLNKVGFARGADSTYYFNPRVGAYLGPGNAPQCRHYRYAENLFGGQMEINRPGTFQATYRLVFGNYTAPVYNDMWDIHPRQALNQPWAFGMGLTAQVTARGTALVLGLSDSVVTISLSDGRQLRLSKTFGLLEGPVLMDYFFRDTTAVRRLLLVALPDRQMGQGYLTPQGIYDFQPGDVFWYNTYSRVVSNPSQDYSYNYADSIMARRGSRSSDTLTYLIWRCSPASPTGFVYTLTVSSRSMRMLVRGTGEYAPAPGRTRRGGVMRTAVVNPTWSNRAVWRYDGRFSWCGLGNTFSDSASLNSAWIDAEQRMDFAVGLGQTNFYEENTTCCWEGTRLIGYRKGAERWGMAPSLSCRPLLSAKASNQPARATAVPNPFSEELTLTFITHRAQAVTLRLFNSLGQVVLDATQVLPAGSQHLKAPTTGLLSGIYSAQILLKAENRREVIKVIKQ